MKHLLNILAVLILITSCNSGNDRLISDLEAANLKGRVRKVEKTINSADKVACCPAGEKDDCKQVISEYDQKGNLVESSTVDYDGNILVTSKYKYNGRGLCSRVEKISDGKPAGKEINVYRDGKLVEIGIFNEEGVKESTLKYDYSGNDLTGGTTLDENGQTVTSFQNEYRDGVAVSKTEKDPDGATLTTIKFTRNDHQDIIESEFTKSKLNSRYKLTYEYEYDSEGNWIKQVQKFDGDIVGIIMRNITYYESGAG